MIIFHEPHVVESVSYIHPMACLFKEIPDLLRIHKGYRRLETIFKKYNIHYAEVTDVLKRDVNVHDLVNVETEEARLGKLSLQTFRGAPTGKEYDGYGGVQAWGVG